MTYLVRLSCGHSGTSAYAPREGGWVSCWALVYPQEGCGTQRRIESVTAAGDEQLVLFPERRKRPAA
ncbi:MAG: hypothetical protein J2P30_01705 [Actinobacteria bacterium]|nr:hypothetical protein [Actinomycetota bacterium]